MRLRDSYRLMISTPFGVVAFQKIIDDHRIYAVTNLKFLGQDVPTWLISISPDFTAWSVKRTQYTQHLRHGSS